jgi:hypothetical protein
VSQKVNGMNKKGLVIFLLAFCAPLWAQAAATGPESAGTVVKRVGTVRKADGPDLWLVTDQGAEVAVRVVAGARILHLAPGQIDLKGATAMPLGEVQAGDRVLVRGRAGAEGSSLEASLVLVMKHEDIAQRNREELLDWQRRGVGGLVRQIDAQARTLSVSVSQAGGKRTVVVRTTPQTTYKRYAPNSVKWEEATPARFEDIHRGDQLRAKGTWSENGGEMVADEIVAGTFRNLSGLITAIDVYGGTLTVRDLATKKAVTVRIGTGAKMRRLPPQVAEGLAMRLKGGPPPRGGETPEHEEGMHGGERRRGDLNQLLARLPELSLGDLQKGEAVIIVTTPGSEGRLPEAVTLLGGVEPILSASPGGESDSLLTPWSLASSPAGDQP